MPDEDDNEDRQSETDKGPSYKTGVHKTPITTDARGRRVRAVDGQVEKFPANKDNPTAGLEAKVTKVETDLAAYKQANDARTITGGGSVFSGNLGSGVKYDPNAAGGPGDNVPGSGTATNPYEMGENRTTTDPTAANDTWTLAEGPDPAGPVTGTDGVVTTNPRYVSNGDGTGNLYTRRVEYDSNGAIIVIGAEMATVVP